MYMAASEISESQSLARQLTAGTMEVVSAREELVAAQLDETHALSRTMFFQLPLIVLLMTGLAAGLVPGAAAMAVVVPIELALYRHWLGAERATADLTSFLEHAERELESLRLRMDAADR